MSSFTEWEADDDNCGFLKAVPERTLGFDNLVSDGVAHESAERRHLKLAHDFRAMVLNGSRTDVQQRSDFLIALAFREQLNDLSLP